jgi:hypothetical protein
MEKATKTTLSPLFFELIDELWQDEEVSLHTVPREYETLLQ